MSIAVMFTALPLAIGALPERVPTARPLTPRPARSPPFPPPSAPWYFATAATQVMSAAINPEGTRAATASEDGSIRIWKLDVRYQLQVGVPFRVFIYVCARACMCVHVCSCACVRSGSCEHNGKCRLIVPTTTSDRHGAGGCHAARARTHTYTHTHTHTNTHTHTHARTYPLTPARAELWPLAPRRRTPRRCRSSHSRAWASRRARCGPRGRTRLPVGGGGPAGAACARCGALCTRPRSHGPGPRVGAGAGRGAHARARGRGLCMPPHGAAVAAGLARSINHSHVQNPNTPAAAPAAGVRAHGVGPGRDHRRGARAVHTPVRRGQREAARAAARPRGAQHVRDVGARAGGARRRAARGCVCVEQRRPAGAGVAQPQGTGRVTPQV